MVTTHKFKNLATLKLSTEKTVYTLKKGQQVQPKCSTRPYGVTFRKTVDSALQWMPYIALNCNTHCLF